MAISGLHQDYRLSEVWDNLLTGPSDELRRFSSMVVKTSM